jgi:hypothetical protein
MVVRRRVHLVALSALLVGYTVALVLAFTAPYISRYAALIALVPAAALFGVIFRQRWAGLLAAVLFAVLFLRSFQFLLQLNRSGLSWDVLPAPGEAAPRVLEAYALSALIMLAAVYGTYVSLKYVGKSSAAL